jgi:hypothetical protein
MRFKLIGKATKYSEAGALPSEEFLGETGKLNEEMIKGGGVLAAGSR